MHSVVVFVALLAAASANTIVRSPSHDSAVIKTERNGGNFAYSVAESPAYSVVSPVVSHVTQPIATTYTVQKPSLSLVTPSHTIVSDVKTTLPLTATTGNVATTYGAWPYASTYTYGTGAVDNSSPIVYTSNANIVGVDTLKQINQVHHTASVVPSTVLSTPVTSGLTGATTYTNVPTTSQFFPTSGLTSGSAPATWANNIQYANQWGYGVQPLSWNQNAIIV